MPRFHEQLRRLRTDRGRTLDDIASAAGVQRSAVSKWERGAVPMPIDALSAYEKALGLRIEIIGRTGAAPPIDPTLSSEKQAALRVVLDALGTISDRDALRLAAVVGAMLAE